MSSAFLDDADLEKLTGYVRPSQQIRRLEAMGIPYSINAKGKPVVLRDMDKMTVPLPQLGPVA